VLVIHRTYRKQQGCLQIYWTRERPEEKRGSDHCKELSPVGIVVLYYTAFIPFFRKRTLLVRSQNGDFHNVQEAAGMSPDLYWTWERWQIHLYSQYYRQGQIRLYVGLNGKFLRFSNEKSIFFLNIFTIFNELKNFHCLLLPSPNVSQAFQFCPCKNSLVWLRHIFENAKKFPFNPIVSIMHSETGIYIAGIIGRNRWFYITSIIDCDKDTHIAGIISWDRLWHNLLL
jgi:hypothetical protein